MVHDVSSRSRPNKNVVCGNASSATREVFSTIRNRSHECRIFTFLKQDSQKKLFAEVFTPK